MKQSSTSLVIKKAQIETFIFSKHVGKNRLCRNEYSQTVQVNINLNYHFRVKFDSSYWQLKFIFYTEIWLLKLLNKVLYLCTRRHMQRCSALLAVIKNLEQPKCPWRTDWMKKTWFIYYMSAKKANDIQWLTWIDNRLINSIYIHTYVHTYLNKLQNNIFSWHNAIIQITWCAFYDYMCI